MAIAVIAKVPNGIASESGLNYYNPVYTLVIDAVPGLMHQHLRAAGATTLVWGINLPSATRINPKACAKKQILGPIRSQDTITWLSRYAIIAVR